MVAYDRGGSRTIPKPGGADLVCPRGGPSPARASLARPRPRRPSRGSRPDRRRRPLRHPAPPACWLARVTPDRANGRLRPVRPNPGRPPPASGQFRSCPPAAVGRLVPRPFGQCPRTAAGVSRRTAPRRSPAGYATLRPGLMVAATHRRNELATSSPGSPRVPRSWPGASNWTWNKPGRWPGSSGLSTTSLAATAPWRRKLDLLPWRRRPAISRDPTPSSLSPPPPSPCTRRWPTTPVCRPSSSPPVAGARARRRLGGSASGVRPARDGPHRRSSAGK